MAVLITTLCHRLKNSALVTAEVFLRLQGAKHLVFSIVTVVYSSRYEAFPHSNLKKQFIIQ